MPGRARTTIAAPGGRAARRGRTISRSRRVTRLRTTALPIFLDTTNPTRGASSPCVSRARCTTTWDRALRTPPRVTARNSSPVWSRRLDQFTAPRRLAPGPSGSSGKLGAALGAAGVQDRAAGAGAHAGAEAVLLGAAAEVRLERALAHGSPRSWARTCPSRWSLVCCTNGKSGRTRRCGAAAEVRSDAGMGPQWIREPYRDGAQL